MNVLDTMLEGQAVRMTADYRTNSIIASGGNASLNFIEVLIERLDVKNAQEKGQPIRGSCKTA